MITLYCIKNFKNKENAIENKNDCYYHIQIDFDLCQCSHFTLSSFIQECVRYYFFVRFYLFSKLSVDFKMKINNWNIKSISFLIKYKII